MKLEKVNQITFVADKISDAELGHFIKLLCEHDYDISVQYDGCCIIIQYDDAAHQHFGNPVNVWIKPEVLEDLLYEDEDDLDEDDGYEEDEDDECDDDYEGMEDDAFRI
jgi:hypothetical protein